MLSFCIFVPIGRQFPVKYELCTLRIFTSDWGYCMWALVHSYHVYVLLLKVFLSKLWIFDNLAIIIYAISTLWHRLESFFLIYVFLELNPLFFFLETQTHSFYGRRSYWWNRKDLKKKWLPPNRKSGSVLSYYFGETQFVWNGLLCNISEVVSARNNA